MNMKRNWNWRWIGRTFICALVICALLATVAIAEDGDIPAQANVDIEGGDGIRLDDGTMADLEDGSIPLDLSSLLSDLNPGMPGASDLGIDDLALETDGSSDAIANSKDDDDALRQAEWIDEGYYKIVAANGRGEGQELYWDQNASWKDLKWKKEGDIWIIGWNRPIESAAHKGYILNIEKLRGGVAVKCTHRDDIEISTLNPNRGLYLNVGIFKEEGSKDYSKVTIRFATKWDSKHNRPYYALKMHRVLSAGNDYVQVQKFTGTSSALWSLVPVNYNKSFGKISLAASAKKSGEITVDWDKFRDKVKDLKVWKEAKYVEVQCSTDKYFEKNVRTKKVERGKVTKKNAKMALKNLKKNTKYYIRARLWDAKGVYSNWSKVIAVTITK